MLSRTRPWRPGGSPVPIEARLLAVVAGNPVVTGWPPSAPPARTGGGRRLGRSRPHPEPGPAATSRQARRSGSTPSGLANPGTSRAASSEGMRSESEAWPYRGGGGGGGGVVGGRGGGGVELMAGRVQRPSRRRLSILEGGRLQEGEGNHGRHHTDRAGVARAAQPRPVPGAARGRDRAAVHRQIHLCQGGGRLPLRRLRQRAVP